MQRGKTGNGKKSLKRNMKRKKKGVKKDGKGGREERKKLHVRRKGKVVEKSENPWYFTLIGTC